MLKNFNIHKTLFFLTIFRVIGKSPFVIILSRILKKH